MTKPKGVWLQVTELENIAEATVTNVESRKRQPSNFKPRAVPSPLTAPVERQRSGRPLLTAALGVCCCGLAALLSLHIVNTRAEALAAPDLAPIAIIAEADVPEADAAYMTEPALDDASALPEPNPEPAGTEPISAPVDEPLQSALALADSDGRQQVLASRAATAAAPVIPAVESGEATEITVGGETFQFARKLSMESTAYTWTGNKTATGIWPVVGTIAVDPRIIPLGSRVYVEGYGFALAADTGGAIKGNIIDVYFDTRDECIKWGRKRGLAVYILE